MPPSGPGDLEWAPESRCLLVRWGPGSGERQPQSCHQGGTQGQRRRGREEQAPREGGPRVDVGSSPLR